MAWTKNGTTTLGSSGSAITVSSLTSSIFNTVLCHTFAVSGTNRHDFFFDNTEGTNYAGSDSYNFATHDAHTSDSKIFFHDGAVTDDRLAVIYIANPDAKDKLVIGVNAGTNGSGAGVNPNRSEVVGKSILTSQITRFDLTKGNGSGSFNTNSNVSVLHVDGTNKSKSIQDGTIFEETDTNKAYIWNASTTTWTQL